jgi:hypothetical protein
MADYEAPANEAEKDDAPDKNADAKLLKQSREGLEARIDAESSQRALMLDDLKFATLDQWPTDIRAAREGDITNGPRPCMTVDQSNQYITQVSNDMLVSKPSIKPRPVDDFADPDTANIFAGLIRHIEDQSSAKIAYQTAGESAVTMGLGFFRIIADYVAPDSFDQDLFIKRVPDTFSVYLGAHIMPDGSDAEEGWVFEEVPIATFERDYPKAKLKDADFEGLAISTRWKTEKTVTVCEYFYKKYTSAKLLFLADGRTMFEDAYEKLPEPRPEITGRRDSQKCKVMWCKHSGCEILDKRELKGKYIPIVEVVGKEKIVEGKRHLWGLVRPAKDSLRAFNYWISALMEKMALAPKAPFIGAVGQFKTMGDKWDKANVNNYAKLEYDPVDVNGNALPAPRRQEPMQVEAAMVQMLVMLQNNVKSSLGMYKAALGETESQQSGRAILALQKESNTGTMHFGENQGISVTHGGRILVDLIPHYIDTKRVLRILGEDGKAQSVQIDPTQRESRREIRDAEGKVKRIYNLGVGTYDVTVTTGPGYTTNRQEAATVMTELANSAKDPIAAAIMRYGAMKNSDFHGSDEIMKMLKAMLPPQLQSQDGEADPLAAAMQKIAQLTQQAQMMQQAGQKLQAENVQLKAGTQADMAKVAATRETKMAEIALDREVQMEREKLAREAAEANFRLERDKALALLDLERLKLGANADADYDTAIAKIQNLALIHQTKVQAIFDKEAAARDAAEGETESANAAAEAGALNQQFVGALQQVVNGLKEVASAKKSITMTLPDGRTASAQVTVQ